MKYMIMLYGSQRDYDAMSGKGDPSPGVSPEDFVPMYEFMEAWNKGLVESGEYVDAHGLSAPVHTRRIQLRDGVQVVTDGPYPETEEVLAGYNIVECASFDRATEIAAELSKCPYPEGAGGEFLVDRRRRETLRTLRPGGGRGAGSVDRRRRPVAARGHPG